MSGVRTFFTVIKGARSAPGRGWPPILVGATRVERADSRAAHHLPADGLALNRGTWRAPGRRLPLFGPAGPRRRRRAAGPRGPTARAGPRKRVSAGARCCKWCHPSGAPILKPRKIVVKSARCARVAARSLRDPGPRVLPRIQPAPIGRMAGSEAWVIQYSCLNGSPSPYACFMPDLQPPDPESLRLELQEAIITFRHQNAQLIQALGVIVTADAALLGYGFAQKLSIVLLVASLMPLAALSVYSTIMAWLVPICHVATKLEEKLSLDDYVPFIGTWVMTRSDLSSALSDFAPPKDREIRNSTLNVPRSRYFRTNRTSQALLAAFAAQIGLVVISLFVYHFHFM